MPLPARSLGALLLVLALGATSRADVLVLKNHASYEGVLVADEGETLRFRADGVEWTFRRENVEELRRDAATTRRENEKEALRQKALARGRAEMEHPVVLYGTSWCGWCAKARAYLASRGIPFRDLDVERDRQAALDLAELRRRAGVPGGGVPVIEVDGRVIVGFDRQRLDAALAARR